MSGHRPLQDALLQQREEARLRHRTREQEALSDVAAHPVHRLQVGRILDSLGHRERTEIMREIDDRLRQMPALRSSVPLSLTKL